VRLPTLGCSLSSCQPPALLWSTTPTTLMVIRSIGFRTLSPNSPSSSDRGVTAASRAHSPPMQQCRSRSPTTTPIDINIRGPPRPGYPGAPAGRQEHRQRIARGPPDQRCSAERAIRSIGSCGWPESPLLNRFSHCPSVKATGKPSTPPPQVPDAGPIRSVRTRRGTRRQNHAMAPREREHDQGNRLLVEGRPRPRQTTGRARADSIKFDSSGSTLVHERRRER
jgi:hypothetical protein